MFDSGHGPRWAPKLLLAVFGALVVAACLDSTIVLITDDDIAELTLSPDSAGVPIGGVLQISPVALDASGTLLVGRDFAWSTGDATIATVDESGLVTGVGSGTTVVVASGAGLQDSTTVTVSPPPELVLGADSVALSGQAGGADPAPDSVDVTNGGVYPLLGLAVDSVIYGLGADGWLTARFLATAAPTRLELAATVAGITQVGRYGATVHVSGADAVGSPDSVIVVLDVAAGAADTLTIEAGDGQTADAGTDVAVAPSVRLADAFDNPVVGAPVTFGVTAGGGSVTGGSATTDANGVATVGSWTLGTTAGVNTLEVSSAGVTAVELTATGTAGPATEIVITAGTGQNAVAGAAVSTDPAVEARDQHGNPVVGIDVVFSVASGGGSIADPNQTTDATGTATSGDWTLGTSAGANTLRAVAASIPDTATFTATALPGSADEIVYVAGDAQVDTVAASLAVYQVRVEDVNDNGIPGITVSWSVAGGGSIEPTSDTDASGIATATRILGTVAGEQTAQASVGGLGSVDFTATANPATPVSIGVYSGGGQNATVATSVVTPPSVVVTDQFGNGVSGESVTFAVGGAGGSVVPTTPLTTDADGIASSTSWTLGTTAGATSDTLNVTAASGTIAPSPLVITANATADAPDDIGRIAGHQQTAVTGTQVATDPEVQVVDQYGNGVPSVTINFSTTGGSVGSAAVVTDADGHAATSWTVDVSGGSMQTDGTFPNVLNAEVDGTALAIPFSADAIYSYATHVDSIFGNCVGCHGAAGGLTFSTTDASANHTALVGATSNCSGLPRVSAAGAQTGVDNTVVLLYLTAGASPPCGFDHIEPGGWETRLALIEAWVRNAAPDN